MSLRLIVIGIFVSAAAVPGFIAYSTGVFPAHTPADSTAAVASPEFRVTSLAWPREALGLSTTGSLIVWEQRDHSKSIAGLWAYDVETQQPYHLLGQGSTGRGTGFPAVSRSTVVWAAWPKQRGVGSPAVQAYDDVTMRRWTVGERGRKPAAANHVIVWIERGAGTTRSGDAIRGVDTVTEEAFSIELEDRARDVAVARHSVSWVSSHGDKATVWTAPLRHGTPRRLSANSGTAVAMDVRRVVWTAARKGGSTAIVAFNRESEETTELCRVEGNAGQLTLNRRAVVWVTTGGDGNGDIWTYDFKRGRAYEVSSHSGQQATPVLAGTTVFWADRRSDQWELYGRTLQP